MSSAKSSTATAGPHAAFAPPGFDRPLLAQRSIRGGPTVRLQPGEVTAVNWRSAERTTAAQPTSQEAHQRLRGPVPTARGPEASCPGTIDFSQTRNRARGLQHLVNAASAPCLAALPQQASGEQDQFLSGRGHEVLGHTYAVLRDHSEISRVAVVGI
jgi:hypothetical protein